MPVVHIFSPLMIQPLTLSRVAGDAGFHMGGVRPVLGLGQAEGDAVLAGNGTVDHRLLVVAAVAVEHGHDRQVSDDASRGPWRQNARGSRPSRGGPVLAAVTLRDRKTQVTGGIGEGFRLAQQRFPFVRRARHCRNRCAPIHDGDERSGCCHRPVQQLDLAFNEAIEVFVEIGDGSAGKLKSSSPGKCRLL